MSEQKPCLACGSINTTEHSAVGDPASHDDHASRRVRYRCDKVHVFLVKSALPVQSDAKAVDQFA